MRFADAAPGRGLKVAGRPGVRVLLLPLFPRAASATFCKLKKKTKVKKAVFNDVKPRHTYQHQHNSCDDEKEVRQFHSDCFAESLRTKLKLPILPK